MSDNYDDRDELAKRMGFDSWEAFLNSETKDISEKEAKEKYHSSKRAFSESTNDFIITKEELERLNNFRSKHTFRSRLSKFKIGKNNWSWLDDEENLEENIQNYISEKGLEGKSIIKEDAAFYAAVNRRGLNDLLPRIHNSDWSWLNDEEHLEENIQNYISENNLEGKNIRQEDFNFYNAVHRRGLKDLLPRIHINYDINNYSKEELKILQDQIYQRLSELEEE